MFPDYHSVSCDYSVDKTFVVLVIEKHITLSNRLLYLAKDFLPLLDAFETFQNTCLKHYKLDPVHFYLDSGLMWQVLLKTASEYCELEVEQKDHTSCSLGFTIELLTWHRYAANVLKGYSKEYYPSIEPLFNTNEMHMKD